MISVGVQHVEPLHINTYGYFKGYKKFPGGYCLEETPDPIPNSAVKLKDANGTAGAAPWESRSPPGL